MPTAVPTRTPLMTRTPLVTIINREHWLQNCGEIIVPHIEDIAAKKLANFLISVSMPTKRGLSEKNRVVGQCIYPVKDGNKFHLFIHPMLVAPEDVAGTIAHELVHILAKGHGRDFGRIALPLGLSKPLKTADPTDAFFDLTDKKGRSIRTMLAKLGPYPHEALDISGRTAAPTLLLPVICPKCGFKSRITKKWIKEPGLPICACDGKTKWVLAPKKRRRK